MAVKTISVSLDEALLTLIDEFAADGGTKNFLPFVVTPQTRSQCISDMLRAYFAHSNIINGCELIDNKGNYILQNK